MTVLAGEDKSLEAGSLRFWSRVRDAWLDLAAGASQSWMWTALAIQDIKLRYRGSVLGPIWLTLSTLVTVAAIGLIYSRLFDMNAAQYLPYLTVGLIVWQFISALLMEGCQTFITVESVIQESPIPLSTHAYRVVFRNLLVLAHSAVVILVGLLLFPIAVDWRVFEVLPALLLISINGLWISILFGMISARFRDVPPIVANFLQVLFLATPIFWPIEALGNWRLIAEINPFFAAVDAVRAPLLGAPLNPATWPLLIVVSITGCVVTFVFFARFRFRIAYWA